MKNSQKDHGVTFIELLVSIVILAATLAGLLSLFGSTKRWIDYSQSRMTVGEIAKQALDPLQMDVRQDQWSVGANCLSAGACAPTVVRIQNRDYNVAYVITKDRPITNVNRVRTDITWNEPEPAF